MLYERVPDRNPTNAADPIVNSRKEHQTKIKAFKTVKYEANFLFVGLNTKDAIHGVSHRSPTHHARKFSAFNCHMQYPTFDWKP